MFQAFQLTALVIRGHAIRGESVIINLDRVIIKEEEMRGVLLCVLVFVPSAQVTQRSFFSWSSLTMLSESVSLADSVTSSPFNAPWSFVGTACAGQVVNDLRACWDRVVLRRRTAIDTSERWYHGGTAGSETASRPGVQISYVVEYVAKIQEGRVEDAPVASPAFVSSA